MTITCTRAGGIAEITMNHPPVNALTVGDTWEIRNAFEEISRDPDLRAAILTAEGRGFNAGIDIKEMQSVEGFEHLLGSGEACYAAFKQIYDCPFPVIAAVNDFCMGLGIGLVGSCDIIVASSNARFGLPEVDNGALGCASHLARMVSPLKLRQMVFTCEPATAAELASWGTVYKVTEPEELMNEARALAQRIAEKPATVVAFAKSALNGIDPSNLHNNYRLEQGYTYQLNLIGEGDAARDAFVAGDRHITR
ncbi:enoyl-CoA hydratase family protein [Myxococcota bacterium]|nr:enoyl-CoA hydratase family protein [Myxococcota bacterium]